MNLDSPIWGLLEPVLFAAFLLGIRMLGVVLALPGLSGAGAFPAPSRMIFVLFLTAFCYSALGMPLVPLPREPLVAIPQLVREFLIGAAMGLTVQVTLAVGEAAGTLVSNVTSLSMATMMDPTSGHESTTLSTLFGVVGMLLFISLDGHHHAVSGLMDNLALFPLGGRSPAGFEVPALIQMGQGLFLAALKVAAPVLLVTSLVNVGLGMMARAAPQLNVFTVGFAVVLLVGLSFVGRSVVSLHEVYKDTIPSLGERMNTDLLTIESGTKP